MNKILINLNNLLKQFEHAIVIWEIALNDAVDCWNEVVKQKTVVENVKERRFEKKIEIYKKELENENHLLTSLTRKFGNAQQNRVELLKSIQIIHQIFCNKAKNSSITDSEEFKTLQNYDWSKVKPMTLKEAISKLIGKIDRTILLLL